MSQRRPKPPCAIKQECGGCTLVNEDYARGLKTKFDSELAALKKLTPLGMARVLPPVPAPRQLGYRTTFKLAVQAETNAKLGRRFRLGLYQPKTHDVGVDLTPCPLHAPALRRLLKALGPLLDASSLSPPVSGTRGNALEYVLARTSRVNDEIQLVFVGNRKGKAVFTEIAHALEAAGVPLCGAYLNLAPESGNAILGDVTEALTDSRPLVENINGLQLEVGPTSFFQVNPWQAENIYRRMESLARPVIEKNRTAVAWDLFCGIGPISLTLARAGFQVFGVEESPEAIEAAKKNQTLNRTKGQTSFLASTVERLGSGETALPSPDLICLNPSRRGIHTEARAFLKSYLAEKKAPLIYLSCDVGTLGRDLADLTVAGWRLKTIQAYDMFAQTDKLEWLVSLEK